MGSLLAVAAALMFSISLQALKKFTRELGTLTPFAARKELGTCWGQFISSLDQSKQLESAVPYTRETVDGLIYQSLVAEVCIGADPAEAQL